MSVIHTPRKPDLDLRLLLFPAAMLLLLGVLFLRLWYFQVVKAPALVERAEESRKDEVAKPAPRGLIFDRHMTPVATVRPEIVITAVPKVVNENLWVLDKVAQLLKVDVKKLHRKLKDAQWRPYLAAPIFVGAPIEIGTRITESVDELPGIGVETLPMRQYPDSKSFTHVLGYVWVPNDKDVKRIRATGREPADYIGKEGVERAYEEHLMGEPGSEEMEIDARRRPIRISGRNNPVPGDQLILSLDARLQRYATQLFSEKGYTGGIAAIDPRSGEVLCLVSSPTFDQNLFQGGITDSEWDSLMNNPARPMQNRAISSAYAPGSTFKIVTAVAAMMAGKFDRNNRYHCPGGYRIGRRFLKCLGTHGSIAFEEAMQKSCNTYFCSLGAAAGREYLLKACDAMSLGRRTKIELLGESRGVIPTDRWLKAVSADDKVHWFAGDLANMSIGQGYVNTTPLQMANVAAVAANNGISYRPHLVRAIKAPDGKGKAERVKPEPISVIKAPDAFWQTLRSSLVRVVEQGTARSAIIPNIRVGGKTGSAEHKKGAKTHGWFVGFAPAENPKIAICVMVEAAGHGGEVAAPIAGKIIERYLTKPVKPVKASPKAAAAASASAAPASKPRAR